MKHSEFEAFIFIGTKEGDNEPTVILNNDDELSIRELRYDKYFYKLDINLENLFSTKEANDLQADELSEPVARIFRVYKGEDWRRDSIYEDKLIKVKFEVVRVNVEVSHFDIDGLE